MHQECWTGKNIKPDLKNGITSAIEPGYLYTEVKVISSVVNTVPIELKTYMKAPGMGGCQMPSVSTGAIKA